MRHDSNKPHWEKVQNFTLLIIVDSLSVNSDALTTFFMRWHGRFYTYEYINEALTDHSLHGSNEKAGQDVEKLSQSVQ